ncbi:MAG: hypothetical protein OXG91_02075 [bacterium]|nr:hypothetical protein [bacterium]MCY3952944.1 hypothetical protein [bacterium]
MTTALILAAVWLAVLAPSGLRRLSRYQTDRKYSSGAPLLSGSSRYNNVVPLTSVVQLSAPRRPGLVPPGLGVDRDGLARRQRERARVRRRNILIGLVFLAIVTLVVAVLTAAGAMIAVHVLVDILLVGYVGALARRQRRVLERHAKVTDIASARTAADPYRGRPQSPAEEAAVSFLASSRGRP